MSTSGPSDADKNLSARLTQQGLETSPWQIRRWRQDGYLKLAKRGLGRGLGTTSFYPEESLRQAAALAEDLNRYGRLDEAAIVVFARGFSVRERGLKRAYASVFDRILRVVRPRDGEDPWDTAYRAARTLSRRSGTSPTASQWRKRLADLGKAGDFPLMLQDLISFSFLGTRDEDEVLMPEAFEAMGDNDLVDDFSGRETDALNSLLRALNVPAFAKAVEGASMSELERARHGVTLLRDAIDDPFILALIGIPAALVAGPLLGGGIAVTLGELGGEVGEPRSDR